MVRSLAFSRPAANQASSVAACRFFASASAAFVSARLSSWNWRTDSAVASFRTSLIASSTSSRRARSQPCWRGVLEGRGASAVRRCPYSLTISAMSYPCRQRIPAVLLALGAGVGGLAAESLRQPVEQLGDVVDELRIREPLRLGDVPVAGHGRPPDGEDGFSAFVDVVRQQGGFTHGYLPLRKSDASVA